MHEIKVDVLIVGAGLSGLTLAALLARQNVSALTIARHPGTAPQPRGSFTNQRTVEIYRDLGIESEVLSTADIGLTMGHSVMATSLAGQEIMRYRSYGTGERLTDYAMASPCQYINASQNIVEPILVGAARRNGADIRFSNELLSITQDHLGVTATVRDLNAEEDYLVHARYAVGADGSRSLVAQQAGISFEGEMAPIHMVNAWLKVDLTKYAAYRPAGLYMLYQPGGSSWVGSGTFISVKKWDEWLLSWEYDINKGQPDTSASAVARFARKLIGDSNIDVEVFGTTKWQVNTSIANRYQVDRIFIVGDAAHRHSPAGGLGLNTCIQDSFNLAWKMAYDLKGQANSRLLASYEEERRPIGQELVDRAMSNLKNKSALADAIGLVQNQEPEEAQEVLRTLFMNTTDAALRRKAIARVRDLQHYRSNAHGTQLGQRYTSCAVVDDGTAWPDYQRDPVLYYHPTTHPGAYLPHVWLERDKQQISILDVIGHDRFCLIVGIGGKPWIEAAESLIESMKIQLSICSVGYRCEYDDPVGDWERIREIDDGGALLVRPDRHIAWRSMSLQTFPSVELRTALYAALCLDSVVIDGADQSN